MANKIVQQRARTFISFNVNQILNNSLNRKCSRELPFFQYHRFNMRINSESLTKKGTRAKVLNNKMLMPLDIRSLSESFDYDSWISEIIPKENFRNECAQNMMSSKIALLLNVCLWIRLYENTFDRSWKYFWLEREYRSCNDFIMALELRKWAVEIIWNETNY